MYGLKIVPYQITLSVNLLKLIIKDLEYLNFLLIGGFMRLMITLFCLMIAVTLTPAQNKMHDEDAKISGSGKIPEGWDLRFDHENSKPEDIQFTDTNGNFNFISGPAAIYFNKKDLTAGNFKSQAEFFQTKASMHPEAYGIFFGGKELKGKDQHYYYFLVRQDGKYLIKSRDGSGTAVIVNWTSNKAINAKDKKGQTKNLLEIEVNNKTVSFLVNGKNVASLPSSKFKNTDGQVGLRINHNLNVQVNNFTVNKL